MMTADQAWEAWMNTQHYLGFTNDDKALFVAGFNAGVVATVDPLKAILDDFDQRDNPGEN